MSAIEIRGIDHVVLRVRDVERSLAFYQHMLGFKKVFDDAGGADQPINYAGVARDRCCIHLQTSAPGETVTMPLIRIAVSNIEELYSEIGARMKISGKLEAKPWGSKDFGVYDPDSAALVFYEDL